jgi:hypothetical protein
MLSVSYPPRISCCLFNDADSISVYIYSSFIICVLGVVFFLVVVVFVFSLLLAVVVNRICFVFIVVGCPLLLCFV